MMKETYQVSVNTSKKEVKKEVPVPDHSPKECPVEPK